MSYTITDSKDLALKDDGFTEILNTYKIDVILDLIYLDHFYKL